MERYCGCYSKICVADQYVYRSPAALTLKYAKETLGFSGTEIPARDLNSVTVPGAAAAWIDTVKELGSGKVTMEEVLSPAINLAENG
jgi:gamma-glutamyltranspeptidase/glutathione hydrolase